MLYKKCNGRNPTDDAITYCSQQNMLLENKKVSKTYSKWSSPQKRSKSEAVFDEIRSKPKYTKTSKK